MEKHEVLSPDIQVQIIAQDVEVASIHFFVNRNVHEGFDVAIAIDNAFSVGNLRSVLSASLQAAVQANWHTLDELGVMAGEESEGEPF